MIEGIEISEKLISFITFLPMFLISIAVHEYSHAFFAHKKGDDTAKNLGRLTLNPFKHADLIGTVLMPLASFASGFALIGWAKPVPIDRRNFQNQLKDDALVSAAGPLSNFLLSVFFLVLFMLSFNISWQYQHYLNNLLWYGVFINVFLCLFNLLPLPPLDGSHILFDLFPNKFTAALLNLGFYGTIILLFLIYSPLWKYFMQLVNTIMNIFIKIAGV